MTLRKTLPSPRVSPFASRERASGREGRLALTFPEKLPPLWYCGSPLGTAVAQAFLVVLPAGERMFIRSVRRYLLQTEDRALRKQIHAFCAQEGHHGAEHVRLSRVIAAQGPHVDAFATRVEGALTRLERTLPSLLLLSMTAAFEHYTAVFAERGLRGDFLSRCPEEIQLLMQWHCAEEIEHKCVAFDVLQQQSQSYLLRAAGFLLSTLMLLVVAVLGGALFFMRGPATPRGWLRSERALWAEQRRSVKKGQFLAYLRPGYHPSQDDSFGLARRWAEAQAAG